jgi:hypothetical protein
MKRYTPDTLPHSAEYIGSTEGPHQMSEELADRLDDTIAPAYITEPDGSRSFFELCAEPATDDSRSFGPHY